MKKVLNCRYYSHLIEQGWSLLKSIGKRVKSVSIKSAIFSIGRSPDNDLQIADQRLSGKHCRLLRKMDDNEQMVVVLEDTSSNGTFINGEMVSIEVY